MQGIDSDLIRGHIDTIILKILYEGDRYGLEIMKEVEEKSNGAYEMKQPTLYSCLKRLETQGLISSYWEDSDIGGKRHYYKLTEAGREAYQANYDDWMRSRKIIDNLISSSMYEGSQYVVVKKDEVAEAQPVQSEQPKQNHVEPDTTVVKYDDEETIPWTKETEKVSASSPALQNDAIVDFAKNGESVSAVPFESEEETTSDEWAEVDEAQASLFEENSSVFEESEPAKAIEHNEEPQVEYTKKPELPEPEEKPESNTPFVFKMDDYVVDSNDSYFDSRENDPVKDYNAPEMKIDGLEEESPALAKETESEAEPIFNTPVYHDFGANYVKPKEEDIWVDESELDEDAIYLNPEQAKEEPQVEEEKEEEPASQVSDGQLSLFGENLQEEEEPAPVSPGNMAFYKATENYEHLNPQYTETEYKDKLSSLMSYTAHEEEPAAAPKKEEAIMVAKDYDQLKAEFEQEGLVVRPHQKMLKESKKTRSYVESNKLNLVRSWTTFGIIAFLLCLTGLIMSNYKSHFAFDFKLEYFLIGIGVTAVVPVIYTILYIINPYKKKPARYAFKIYFIFAILLTVQMLIITYCVSLQLGFYSFTQPLFNHLIWVIPSIVSLYPILDALLHCLYFNSRNFHV